MARISANRVRLNEPVYRPQAGMSLDTEESQPAAGPADRAEAHHWIDKTLQRIGPDVEVDVKQYEGHVRSMFKRMFG